VDKRRVLAGLLSCFVAVFATACRPQPPSTPTVGADKKDSARAATTATTPTTDDAEAATSLPPLRVVERVVGGAKTDDLLPLVILMHGLGDTPEGIADIRQTTAERPTRGRAVVTGFSQGGAMSFALAIQHPDIVAAALPLSGRNYVSPAGESSAPIRAFHGGADRVVPVDAARASVKALRELGRDATLQVFEGVGHSVPPQVQTAWRDAVERALKDVSR
jgi:predicted esterase